MLHNSAQKIADFLCKKNVIDKKEIDVYTYGYETLISALIDFILIIILGMFFSCILRVTIAFIMFISIRLYTGGYHANSYIKCKLMFCSIMICIIVLSNIQLAFSIVLLTLLLFNITVFCLAPIENPNKPITKNEKKRNRIISVILSVIWSVIGIITYFCAITIYNTITVTTFFIMLLMVLEYYRKGVLVYEKE